MISINKYIYTHKNPYTNKVFYVGLCYSKNDRINDSNNRNQLWQDEVNKIGGLKNIIKEKIVEGDYTYSELRTLEYEIAQHYYEKGENYCSRENNVTGKNNPNYGNKWTNEQKEHMRQMMIGKYDGKNNPNYGNKWNSKQKDNQSRLMIERYANGFVNGRAKPVELFIPDQSPVKFIQKTDMRQYQEDMFGCSFNKDYPERKVYSLPPKGKEKLKGQYYKYV